MRKLTCLLAAAGGAVLSFFTGLPPLLWVLVAVMSLDFLTGIACGLSGRSPKTVHGGLASGEAVRGLLKKGLILLVVLLAALLDRAVALASGEGFTAVTGATCLWFIAAEGMSILENAAAIGVPVPGILLQALEIMRAKGDRRDGPEA